MSRALREESQAQGRTAGNLERPPAALLETIRDDHRSGAGAIAIQAVDYLEALAAGRPDPGALERGILALPAAQPDMAVLLHLAGRALAGLAAAGAAGVSAATARFRADEESARGAIARRAAPLLAGARRVVTLSASGTVELALAGAARAGLRFEVVVAESRPALEGRDLAARLAAAGLRVTVMVDAALPGEVRSGDLVTVGADRLGWDGFVNKVGTRALVATAAAARLPIFVLTPSTRFVPERVLGAPEASARPANEVWEAPPPGVKVVNRTFESVPLSPVTGIVVEDAVLRPVDAVARALAVELDPRLAAGRLTALRLLARTVEDG
jgi:translation initiation factor 2B subunit (eIF-2B alpha/beta/delta family)